MKATLDDLLKRIPGTKTDKWPLGEPFTEAMRHGTMSVEVFAPRVEDTQEPHEQDELYFVVSGHADFEVDGKKGPVKRATSSSWAPMCRTISSGCPRTSSPGSCSGARMAAKKLSTSMR